MGHLDRRIERIESFIPVPTPGAVQAAEATQRRYLDVWDALVSTMAPEHVEMLSDAVEAHGYVSRDGSLSIAYEAGNFARTASRMVAEAVAGRLQGPLALPEAVARIYLDDPRASRTHECERCGYRVPIHSGTQLGNMVIDRSRRYFDHCPLCGGQCGYSAYFMTMRGEIQRYTICGELKPETLEHDAHVSRHVRQACRCEKGLNR